MRLVEIVTKDMTEAMKTQDKFTLSVLRMLKSALQMEKISKNHDLTDEEAVMVIKRQVKQRKDSITEYTKFGKLEEVANLTKEIEVLSKYLPEELSEDALNQLIDTVFLELKPESIKDMGKVMKEITARSEGRADMTVVSSLVKVRLNS